MNNRSQEDVDRKGAQDSSETAAAAKHPKDRRLFFLPFVYTFFIMYGIWVLLSGKFDAFHMSLGVISCLLVAYLSSDFLFSSSRPKGLFVQWLRFALYVPWLMIEITKANIHVMKLVLHPKGLDLIDPRIIKFRSKLKSNLALVTFANSITLTPGTITVYVSSDGDFKVHAIDAASGDPLPGEMERRIAKAFGED